MTDFENVSELVRKTGASFEEARYAYEACGKDMLAASEMLEKAHGRNESVNDMFRNARNNFRKCGRCAGDCAGNIFTKLRRNYVSISGKREYFCMPVIAAVLCLIFFGSFFCPRYTHIAAFRSDIYILRPRFFKEIRFRLHKTRACSSACTDL